MESLLCEVRPVPVLALLPELEGDNTGSPTGLAWLIDDGIDCSEPIVVTVMSLL